MKDDGAIWYLSSEGGQTAGPYTEEQIMEEIGSERHSEATLCWREGMEGWQPLGGCEPFATEFKRLRTKRRKRAMRITAVAGLIACLAAGGLAAYFVLMGPAQVREGRKLIDRGFYGKAAEVLTPYVANRPLDNEARYLLAIARINQYATGDTSGSIVANLLSFREMGGSMEDVRKDLERVLAAEPEWKERARSDLAAAAGRVPSGAVDAPTRALTIARLRAELDLADNAQLAAELLTQVASPGKEGDLAIPRNQEVVLQIYDWDASLGKRIVELVIAAGSGPKRQLWTVLPTLEQWASQRPALAGEAASQLLSMAQSLYEAERIAEAKTVLSKALAIDPKTIKTREQILLCVRLMDPGEPKLLWCRFFWDKYPNDPVLPEVLLTIVKDAVAAFDRHGRWDRAGSQPSTEAGLAAATTLVQKQPKTAELDVHVYELIKRLVQDRQCEKADALAKALLAAVPASHLMGQIQASLAGCEGPPPPPPPGLAFIKNAIAYHDRTGTWDGPTGQEYMEKGLSAAKELLEGQPKTAGLDALVYELAKRSVKDKRCPEGLDLTRRLLAAIPGSALRRPIETSIAQWQRDCQPPVKRITDASELQKALAGGAGGNLLWVALSRTAVGVENIKRLQDWTRAGGILWAETDLAEAFGLGNVIAIPSQRWRGDAQVPSLPSAMQHPIVKGLQGKVIGYEISASGGVISGSQQDILSKMIPLLVQFEQGQQGRRPTTIVHVFCGVRRHVNGFVVFRPMKIDATSEEGRSLEERLKSPGP